MKKINDKKLEAFTLGVMGKRTLSRKELEDQKKKEEEEAAANAFREFVETFQEAPSASTKVWIKAGTYDAGSRREDNRDKGKLYKPSSKLGSDDKSTSERALEYAKMLAADNKKDSIILKKKNTEKKKSNLELFKEELRQIQEEREERHKYKHSASQSVVHNTEHVKEAAGETGSFDNGDPNTTNLYLGNLSPKISEQQLMELFGRYGPLASIKIMWPRSEEEKSRGRNCGFVAYMSRKDAERALKTLHGRYVMGYEMRLGWGKSVPILNQPIFIPPTLLELTMPPPPSGLPFNAQPPANEINNVPKMNYKEYTEPEQKDAMEKVLRNSVVKVFVPTEKSVLNVIHRMIEFVIREGPMFEALVMSREMDNALFSFLFDNESPAHIYYRWKLFSLLQGDTPTEWREKEFRMFEDGPIWKPPIADFYTQGMADDLVVDPDAPEIHKGALSTAQRDRLEDLIRHITPDRTRIGDTMIFCIEHAEAADEISECIAESLANPDTLASKKIARLYLVSDILHNCTVKVSNASFFRKAIENHLVEIFESIHSFFTSMESRLNAEGVKSRVLKVIRAWEEWAVYPKEFLAKLKGIFLGIQIQSIEEKKEDGAEIDGTPLSGDEKDDEDLDGIPLDGAALLKGALLRGLPDAIPIQKDSITTNQEASEDMEYDDDIDGVPLDDDIDGIPLEKCDEMQEMKGSKPGAFIPSKWETVDPEKIEAQAITTSKWDTLDPPEPPKFYESDEDNSGDDNEELLRDVNEVKRSKLREIEMKTMQYQDELESGQRDLKSGWTITQQVEHYRKKLLKKDIHRDPEVIGSPSSLYLRSKEQRSTESPTDSIQSKKSRRTKKSPSPLTYSAKSSPSRNNKRHSRSPYSKRDISPVMLGSSNRSSKSSKRHRSRSLSDSPKRFLSKSSKYESSPRSRRSPLTTISRHSPLPSRSRRSPEKVSPRAYGNRSPNRHRSDKHKHKHKH